MNPPSSASRVRDLGRTAEALELLAIGLTQTEVAEVMNVTRQTVSYWVRGHEIPVIEAPAELSSTRAKVVWETFMRERRKRRKEAVGSGEADLADPEGSEPGVTEPVLNELQWAAAGMLARGKPKNAVAKALGLSVQTVRAWAKQPAFIREFERVQASSQDPNPRGILLDALSARKDDSCDWTNRVKAALALIELGPESGDDHGGARITVVDPESLP